MLHGQRIRADAGSDTPGRRMNRNVTWPVEMGGHQQWHKGRTRLKKELRNPNSKLFGEKVGEKCFFSFVFPAGLFPTSCHLSPTSFHLSPRLGACGRVPGWLVSHFLSFVSHFFSFVRAGCLWSGLHGLSPTCFQSHFFHWSPTSFHLSPSNFSFFE